MEFYLVDVFAETKYTGNQLAVFKAEKNLSSDKMQKIAREINFSETTFILGKQENSGYDVRIFTPEKEIPFAGHPTLGTAFIIKNEIETEPSSSVILNVRAGAIPVSFDKGEDQIIWMKQNPPVFNRTFDKEMMAEVLGIDTCDMDLDFPIQEVSTGLPAVIVPLNSLSAVKKCKINKDRFEAFMKETEASLLVFSTETYHEQNHINTRVFCDCLSVPEDPATGSAIGDLAGYLLHHGYFNQNDLSIRAEQGYEINRPSLLYIEAHTTENSIEIHIGGNVHLIAKGTWRT
ncbi:MULTISPECIES: PhzF family phenazine biosynthesis protein [Bacillus]|uniref:Trans-2,3-dihydro-3-hydroxyanthranilate isomerase n=1 Tax=Bacillus paralicheniformis TaxID=1648923 RepID=A0ABY3FNM7_9BACI|nr:MULTISPECIES: PhzF family phenazine biosynthesis protein [Bacillus]KUL16486.1 phenazine biosynthesis protein [Bacillus licheniformis LMG 6934]KFM90078.1 phenazine biosynthesis, PhzF family protein [Bacillus paralicheniformis]MBG9883220.1 phenazine biosynthesis protein [Bacillus paralicheniformis]MBU8702754.1 PhzF family phenazine biosynthesis protein [Bacillus paralicheniformis]MCD2368486.1 PhzF family phenazine biosynthesis protein [Bacillus sp. BS3(2021)]